MLDLWEIREGGKVIWVQCGGGEWCEGETEVGDNVLREGEIGG